MSWIGGRVLVGVCVAAVFLVYVSLQTHLKYGDVRAIEQEEQLRVAEHPPQFKFVIKLLTYNRLHSFIRCLDSLASADYGSHVVKLHVFIDHFPLSDAPSSGAVEGKLKEAHDLVNYADQFAWIHGPKEIHYRMQNAGLQGQWLEAWWPSSEHEFAFMVEDDMRVSPFYFKYLRQIIEMYYYNPSNYDPSVYGISLQRPRFVPGDSLCDSYACGRLPNVGTHVTGCNKRLFCTSAHSIAGYKYNKLFLLNFSFISMNPSNLTGKLDEDWTLASAPSFQILQGLCDDNQESAEIIIEEASDM